MSTNPLALSNEFCCTQRIDGGWLLYMVTWKQHQTWLEIANSYLSYVQCLGSCSQKIIVVFDGYSRSPKDHDHFRRTKNSSCDLQIRPDMFHWTQERSSWTTLITGVSWSTSSLQPSENITSLWSSVTTMLTLRLLERHWVLLQIALLRSVTFVFSFTLLECSLCCVWTAHHAWRSLSCSLFRSGQKIQTCW